MDQQQLIKLLLHSQQQLAQSTMLMYTTVAAYLITTASSRKPLRAPYSRRKWTPPRKKRTNRRRNRGRHRLQTIDIRRRTGLWDEDFYRIYRQLRPRIILPRRPGAGVRVLPTSLYGPMRLILVLHWLRSYPKYDDLAELYEISRQ